MKRTITLLIIAAITFVGCKKNSVGGSPFTRSLAGTRNYSCINQTYTVYYDTTTTGTVTNTINYINDAILSIVNVSNGGTVTLQYSSSASSDSIINYTYGTLANRGILYSLSYHVKDSIIVYQVSGSSAIVTSWVTTCTSL